ncbi:MAG: hypothetical protein ACI9EF_003665 [Pseudohongiellaceae bacterium]|jgi:hypothetical protein
MLPTPEPAEAPCNEPERRSARLAALERSFGSARDALWANRRNSTSLAPTPGSQWPGSRRCAVLARGPATSKGAGCLDLLAGITTPGQHPGVIFLGLSLADAQGAATLPFVGPPRTDATVFRGLPGAQVRRAVQPEELPDLEVDSGAVVIRRSSAVRDCLAACA